MLLRESGFGDLYSVGRTLGLPTPASDFWPLNCTYHSSCSDIVRLDTKHASISSPTPGTLVSALTITNANSSTNILWKKLGGGSLGIGSPFPPVKIC